MRTSLHIRVRDALEAALAQRTVARTAFLRQSVAETEVLREALALLPHYAAVARSTVTGIRRRETWLLGRSTIARLLAARRDEPELRPPFSIPPYTVVATLGRGGMGVVYRAIDPLGRREVAIKLLHSRMTSPEERFRFKQEQELLRQLRHPGIVRLHHGDAAPLVRPGGCDAPLPERQYFVMEYVQGESLLDYAEQRQLDSLQRLALFAEICAAVAYAHHRGVIHRDLKPENILVDRAGRPKILDFGIARLQMLTAGLPSDGPHFTGTVAYASPEQLAGQAELLMPASDVYTLGLMLHELLTGQLPPRQRGEVKLDLRSVRLAESRAADSSEGDLRDELLVVIATALRKIPGRRYVDAAELGADVASILAARPARGGWREWFARLWPARSRPAESATHERLLTVLLRRRIGWAIDRDRPDGSPRR